MLIVNAWPEEFFLDETVHSQFLTKQSVFSLSAFDIVRNLYEVLGQPNLIVFVKHSHIESRKLHSLSLSSVLIFMAMIFYRSEH